MSRAFLFAEIAETLFGKLLKKLYICIENK